MNYRDQWATDDEGNRFVFTVEMQRRLQAAGLPVEPESLSELGEAPSAPAPATREAVVSSDGPERDDLMPDTVQIDPETGKYIGRLKWYNPSRGYGFIARGAGEDIFFHKSSALVDPMALEEGQWVLYDVEQRKKGPEATEVETYEGDLAT